jgi:predicted nucleotidyltransferase
MSLRKVIELGGKSQKTGTPISPPSWLPDNLCYETIMGSDAYGVSSGASDKDVYGVVFAPLHMTFPHLGGEIPGFGRQLKRFENWQEHHIETPDKEVWDFQVYSIVNYFQLAMDNNPNIIDSMFTPRRCVLSSTTIGELIRERRKDFLHKGSWHKLKGYSYSQLAKIKTKTAHGKRAELVETYGFDVKFAYHVVRLLLQAEMIMVEHDLDLERHREQLKAIRRGEWTEEQLREWAQTKEKQLEEVYTKSTLRHGPDEPLIKALLLQCLEHHYGSLDKAVAVQGEAEEILRKIASIIPPKYQ